MSIENFWTGRRVWITGSSSGIGWALAEELAVRGAHLALSARREKRLRELAGACSEVDTLVAPLDVTDREATRRVTDRINERWGRLDSVILNAGISELNESGTFDADAVEAVHRVNFLGNVYGIEASLPLLDESEDPHLTGISSASAYGPLPWGGCAYGSSKTAQKYLFESLQFDLEPRGIRVSIVCPGFIDTPLLEKNHFPMPFMMEPEEAARRIADGLARGKPEVHFPKILTLTTKVISKLPNRLYRWILNRVR